MSGEPAQALKWTKQTVAAKLRNELAVVKRFRNRAGMQITRDEIALKGMLKRSGKVNDGQKLLGFEGVAGQKYWSLLRLYYKGQLPFGNRSRRPPRDAANALFSFTYALAYQYFRGLLQGYGFDPFIGFYHTMQSRRYSLALDLVEPFRPVCDRFLMALLNQRRLDEKDFEQKGNAVYLNEQGRRKVLERFYRFMAQKGKWANFSESISLATAQRITVEKFRAAVKKKSEIIYPELSE